MIGPKDDSLRTRDEVSREFHFDPVAETDDDEAARDDPGDVKKSFGVFDSRLVSRGQSSTFLNRLDRLKRFGVLCFCYLQPKNVRPKLMPT